jgi:hypothetical protein
MFTLPSFPKLFVLIGVIVAIWYAFRFLGAVEKARKQAERVRRGATAGARSGPARDVANVEDTVKCRICGAYVPARQPSRCGRSDCPF